MRPRIGMLLMIALMIMLIAGAAYAKQPSGFGVICGQVTIETADGNTIPAPGWNVYAVKGGAMVGHVLTDVNGCYAMAVAQGDGYTISQEAREGYTPDPWYYQEVRVKKTTVLNFTDYEQ